MCCGSSEARDAIPQRAVARNGHTHLSHRRFCLENFMPVDVSSSFPIPIAECAIPIGVAHAFRDSNHVSVGFDSAGDARLTMM